MNYMELGTKKEPAPLQTLSLGKNILLFTINFYLIETFLYGLNITTEIKVLNK